MPSYYRCIPGWGEIGPYYQSVAESMPEDATLVEIGVWQGRSSIYMAEALKEIGKPAKFYLVDSFDGGKLLADIAATLEKPLLSILRDHIAAAGVVDQITAIIDKSSINASQQFADQSIDFAFIDADHDYASVRQDLTAWWPKIKPGGILAGHDYGTCWEGVTHAVNEFVLRSCLDFQLTTEVWQVRKQKHPQSLPR
jgi:predicted O-methyltransferase YrrM